MNRQRQNPYAAYLHEQTHTPQTQPIPGSEQVRNSAGGYSFAVDKWTHLTRFLVLGSEGGSYYASQRDLTAKNAKNVLACIEADGPRAVREIVAVSDEGRAPRNTPAIFALALAAAAPDVETRQQALAALPDVCRTGTHLFQFAGFVSQMRGWGRALRRAVGNWYTEQPSERVAYQMTKYRQREGWSHTDLIRLGHPNPADATRDMLFGWATSDDTPTWATVDEPPSDAALRKVWAYERASRAETVAEIVRLIEEERLVREAIPTGFLNEPEVWAAMLPHMPVTATLRNLGNMSKVGLLTPLSEAERIITERLTNREALEKARVHPLAVLSALKVYESGRGFRGKGEWKPTPRTVDALDAAFELAFGAVEPANKRTLLALDVSGSMGWGNIAGLPMISPRVGSAAMALVTARTEPSYHVVAFSHEMQRVRIRARMSLSEALERVSGLPFGGTDCALPMIYARERGIPVDTFVIYTDNETWAGEIHPVQALRDYRESSGIAARLIVVGMVANNFTIADPKDAGMLDVVGFDTAAPALMNAFARGEV